MTNIDVTVKLYKIKVQRQHYKYISVLSLNMYSKNYIYNIKPREDIQIQDIYFMIIPEQLNATHSDELLTG